MKRTEKVEIRVAKAEKAKIEAAAKQAGAPASTWARMVLLKAAALAVLLIAVGCGPEPEPECAYRCGVDVREQIDTAGPVTWVCWWECEESAQDSASVTGSRR